MTEEKANEKGEELFSDISDMDDRPSIGERIRNSVGRLKSGGPVALVFLFLIGILFGVAAKSLARERIMVGYWDYTVSSRDVAAVNVNALEKAVTEKARQAAAEAQQQIQNGNTPPIPEPPVENSVTNTPSRQNGSNAESN